MAEQEQHLPPMPVFGYGGIAGFFLAYARQQFRASGWPVNLAMRVFDACWQNDFGHERATPEAGFTVLPYGGLDLTKQMIRDQINLFDANRDIDMELLAAEEAVLTKDGTLKSPHAMAPVIFQTSGMIDADSDSTVDSCDRNRPEINRRAMNQYHVFGPGGVGPATATAAMMLNYLRRMDPAVAGGREYSQSAIMVGASFFESDPLFERMQAIQAAFLRMWDIIGREGTKTRDHRFEGGVLPGFERFLAGVAAGNERPFPPNFVNQIIMLEKDDMGGGRLNLDETKEMVYLALKYWAKLPTFVSALLSRQGDAYRDVRGRQIAEGAYYRYASFGLRAIELPAVEETRQVLLGKAIGEKVLGRGGEEVTLSFSPEQVNSLRSQWEATLTEEGVILPSENALAEDILTAPDPLTPIMREVEKVRQTIPRRIAEVLDSSVSADLEGLQASLQVSLQAARAHGSLRATLKAFESLRNRLEVSPPALPAEGDWQRKLETMARQLEIARPAPSAPEEKPKGIFWRISWLIDEVRKARRANKTQGVVGNAAVAQVESNITPEMRRIARDAARLILERGRLVRLNEINVLLSGIRSFVQEDLDTAIRELRAQIDEVALYVTEAEAASRSLHEQSSGYSAICFKLSVPLAKLNESLPVTAGMVEGTLAALAAGKPAREALAHGAPLQVDFVDMLLTDPEARRFLARSAAVEPQNRVDKRELGKARAVVRRFIVIPDDPRVDALLDALKLPENIERHRVPGLKAIICYAQIDALPARAFQTTRLCETSLDGLDDRNRKLVTLWRRYLEATSRSKINRLESDQKVQATLLLTPHCRRPGDLGLKLNGISIFGQEELHPFLEHRGQRFWLPGDVLLSGRNNAKLTFQPIPTGMNVTVSEGFIIRHLDENLKVREEVSLQTGVPTIKAEATGLYYYLPGEVPLSGTTGAKLVFKHTSLGLQVELEEGFNHKLLNPDGSVLDDNDLVAGEKILLPDDKFVILKRATTGEEFCFQPKPAIVAATLTDKSVLVRQATGEQYHYWPHDRTLWQDQDGIWWIAINIKGGTRFERSLHTEDVVVAMDVIFQKDDFREAIEQNLQECVINLDVGAESLLKSALEPMDTWITTQRHLLEAKSWDEIDDSDKPEREEIEDIHPIIERIHEEMSTFSAGRWTRPYRRNRPSNLVALRRAI